MEVLSRSTDKSFIRRLWTDNADYTVQRRIWLCGGYIGLVVVAHGTVHSRGVPSPGPSFLFSFLSFLHCFLFGVNSLAFDSCSVLTLIFTFASFYKMDGFDGFYESLSVRRGGVFLLFFFSYFITSICLGTLGLCFFLSFLAVTWFSDFSLLERSKMGAVFGCGICFFALSSNSPPLPLTPFVSLRGVFDICFTTRACPWSCFFLLDSAFALCFFFFFFLFLFLMGSLFLSLSGFRFFCFSVF